MVLSRTGKRVMLSLFAIPFLFLFMVRILPMLYTVYLSLNKYNMIWDKEPIFVWFNTYLRVLTDKSFIRSIGISFIFAIVAVAIQYVLGLSEALLLDYSFRNRHILLGIIILPMVLAPSVVGIVWYILYNDRIGLINFLLSAVHLPTEIWLGNTKTALISVIITDVWQWTPFVFILLSSSLQTVPKQLYEAAKVDGASGLQVVRYIKLPMLKAVTFSTILLRFMDAFREYDKVYIMTNGGPGVATDLSTIHIYKAAFKVFNASEASAMAVTLLVIISLLYAIFIKYSKSTII